MSLNKFTGVNPFDAVLGSLTVNQAVSGDVGLTVSKTGADLTTPIVELHQRVGDTGDFINCKKDVITYFRLTDTGDAVLSGFLVPLPLPTANLPAAASYEGHMCFDSTTKKLVYSNGTVWVQVP